MIIEFAPFRLDLDEERVWRGSTLLALQRKPFAVLRYLVANPHRLVSRKELTIAVWGNVAVSESALRTHLHELRRVLKEGVIETVVGRGYRFIAQFTVDDAHATIEQRSSHSSSPRSTPRPVGRDEELTVLGTSLQRASAGESQVVFVLGEAGIGKTTLVECFLEEALGQGALSAHGRCVQQHGGGEAFLPVLQALEGLSGGPAGQRVRDLLHQHAPSWLLELPRLVDGGQLDALRRRVEGGTKARMLRELADTLEVLSLEQPIILTLEDLQWTDRATIDLIAMLGQRRRSARIMVIATSRKSDALEKSHPLNSVMRELVAHRSAEIVSLGSLNEPTAVDYLSRRFVQHALPREFATRLFWITGGMPLFMVAFVDDLVARQMVRESEGGWRLGASLDEIAAHRPESVTELINMQLERLTHEEQRVLEAGSVAGVEFATGLVAAALEIAVEDVEEVCDGLVRRGHFLRPARTEEWPDGTVQSRYALVHALHRHACFERIIPARRRRWHRNIGHRLETAYGQRAGEIANQLAVHHEHAEQYARAAHYCAIGAEGAVDRVGDADAIDRFEKGLALLARVRASSQRDRLELRLLNGLAPLVQWSQGKGHQTADGAYAAAEALPPQPHCMVGTSSASSLWMREAG